MGGLPSGSVRSGADDAGQVQDDHAGHEREPRSPRSGLGSRIAGLTVHSGPPDRLIVGAGWTASGSWKLLDRDQTQRHQFCETDCSCQDDLSRLRAASIVRAVPKLWTETIEEHRNAVRDATLDATAELIAEHGLRGVTMSRIAQHTGIGRATLYKYFDDVDAILLAWHERQIHEHLHQLTQLRDTAQDPDTRLRVVLERYALLQHKQAATCRQ